MIMNKRISTLLAAGLLIAGSPLYDVAAKVVEPQTFLNAIVADSLDVAKLDLGSDLKIELNGDVNITTAETKAGDAPTTSGHLFIKHPGLTITKASGKQVKFTGRLTIQADGVTVEGLDIIHNVSDNQGSYYKTAIVVEAKSATIKGNTITCSSSNDKLANGITIFPTAEDAEFTVSGNTIKNANTSEGQWTSSAIIVAEGCSTPSIITSAVLKDFNVSSISNNTYEKCAADYVYVDYSNTEATLYKAAQVTPVVASDGSITNTNYVKALVGLSDNGKGMFFNGTAEQLAKALANTTDLKNVPIKTNDGLVVSGVAQLQPTITTAAGEYELVKKPNANDYYLLVCYSERESGKGSFITVGEENGEPGQINLTELTAEKAAADNNLWKMEQYLDKDGDYTFIFTNKAGQVLTVGDKGFFHSVGNAPYDNGVVFNFNMEGTDLSNKVNKYYGLYRAGLHTMTAGELNFIENDGFSITIKPEGLVGNPFSGKLAPMTWDATNKKFVATDQASSVTEYYLKNEDGDYIVAKLFGAEGGNKDDAYYVFTTASEEDLIADLKATKNENRKLFGEFKTFYKPVGAHDDMEKIERIDSMEVKVLAQDKTIKCAPVGYANISTTDKTEKTLTASLESAQYPISFTMGNNVVDPKTIVQGKFVTITKITEDGNEIYAATDCSGEGTWVEAVGNALEAQWAVTYDTDKNEYTLTNRENLAVKKVGIKKNLLREDDNNKDNLYLFDGDVVKIEAIDVEESDGYKWLGEVDSKLFKIAHWSGVHEAQAWVTTNEDGYALVNIDESEAINIAADAKVDTARVESTLGYFDGATYETKKNVLKVPVYVFQTVDRTSSLGLENGKYMFDLNADTLAIREDAGHYNLRVVGVADKKPVMECAKVYASLSPSDDTSYLKKANGLYIETTNDLFDVVDNDAPLYRRFNSLKLEGNEGDKADTLRFYEKYRKEYLQVENNENFKVEGIDLLGIYTPDFTKDGKSFIVDTAWVRRSKGEKKPQYLISINRQDQAFKEGERCPICQKYYDENGEWPAGTCIHDQAGKLPFHFGQYLVNFADSVKNAANKADYAWKGYTRAGFVKAAHMGDSLYVLTGQFADMTVATFDSAKIHKAVADKKYDKKYIVDLTGNEHKLVTWSMRFVDPTNAANEEEEDRAFLMESVAAAGQPAIAPSKASWLKMQNGCLVLSGTAGAESSFNQFTDDDDALIFNVEKGNKEDLATDNEEITTSEMKVIAGEGNVTIAGATGKKVVITNILGQVVANTVLVSDNAVIAAPQGIVVVAVEGEEAVKAIVK